MCGIIIVGQGVAQVIISIQEELNMENCKFLNLKNMKETIVNYAGKRKDYPVLHAGAGWADPAMGGRGMVQNVNLHLS